MDGAASRLWLRRGARVGARVKDSGLEPVRAVAEDAYVGSVVILPSINKLANILEKNLIPPDFQSESRAAKQCDYRCLAIEAKIATPERSREFNVDFQMENVFDLDGISGVCTDGSQNPQEIAVAQMNEDDRSTKIFSI